ncbi:MAG: exodeoxyribonuclease VII large subunit [Defluviitaleaceae bacterium]|nr:exodeoxyribonuclease VII large subunit [Defluviitaleaceae bacterium]
MKIQAYKVSKIVDYLKELLEEDMFLCSILVQGEVSNFRKHSAGHMYFSLVDEQASLRCCMFNNDAQHLKFAPKNGDMVRIYGRISVYKKMGDVQFVGELMEPAGQGKIYHDIEALKVKLDAEGVFDNRRDVPQYPNKIAIVTSPTGAAVWDIINTIKRRNPLIKLVVVPTLVQGAEAPQDIADAIEFTNTHSGADILIVGRGGGSAEDLGAFNTEIVARAVFGSKIPVISAVGHEIDWTICDAAADMRAATPTAAAELATTPTLAEMAQILQWQIQGLAEAMEGRLRVCRVRLANRHYRLSPQRELAKINTQRGALERRDMAMGHAMMSKIGRIKSGLTAQIHILEKISPLAVLQRGFVVVTQPDGKIIHDGRKLAAGQKVGLQFADITREAEIL